jgi:protein-S-isoprenylcysteine O-methyltransferase Ste14
MNTPNDLIRHAWRRTALAAAFLAVMLFAPADTIWFWQGWLFGFVFVASTAAISAYFLKHDPKLVERRMNVGPTAEQEPSQKIIMAMIAVGFLLLLAVPGIDYHWHWSAVPPWLVIVANGFTALSFVIFFVVMKQNSYAASTIKVEPGQPVISTGVYGIVRHPMYARALLMLDAMPLALGSYWTLLILIPMIPVLAWRLIDEERFLSRNLSGYAAYCRTTRYRLIPFVW